MDRDAEHLRLLSIFYYVVGGMLALFACIPIIHVILGLVMINAPSTFGHGASQPPAFVGWLFLLIGGFAVFFGWVIAGLMVYAGHCLAQRRHYLYCLIVAGISCLFMPLGTILGIFTILVLQRDRVKEMFRQVPALS